MRKVPLWQDQAPMPAELGTDEIPETADVAIVGGGYTGLVAARHLADAGRRVLVLDRDPIGFGASSRNGGKALVGLKHDASAVVRQFGRELGEALWRASLDGIDMVERIAREEDIDCEFERTGSVFLACRPRHYAAMQRESEWLAREYDYHRVDVDPQALGEEIGTSVYHGGTVDPLSAGVHPAKWVRGLARSAAARGAALCAGQSVQAIVKAGSGWRLRTDSHEVSADAVLIATNGYTGSLVRGVQKHVMPVGSYIIATEVLSEALQKALSPRRRMFYDSKWFLKYFRITTDGRMLFGGRTTISTGQDLTQSAAALKQDMVAMFPQLRGAAISHSWGGQLGVTFDAMPHIGRHEGIWFALGYGGHGVALSSLLGSHVAEMINAERRASVFFDAPQRTWPLTNGTPWFRPVVGWGLRLADLVF